MDIVDRRTPPIAPDLASRGPVRSNDGWILPYVAVALIALLATIYFASAGPGMTEAQLAAAAVWP
jgi:hypothetical protein